MNVSFSSVSAVDVSAKLSQRNFSTVYVPVSVGVSVSTDTQVISHSGSDSQQPLRNDFLAMILQDESLQFADVRCDGEVISSSTLANDLNTASATVPSSSALVVSDSEPVAKHACSTSTSFICNRVK